MQKAYDAGERLAIGSCAISGGTEEPIKPAGCVNLECGRPHRINVKTRRLSASLRRPQSGATQCADILPTHKLTFATLFNSNLYFMLHNFLLQMIIYFI